MVKTRIENLKELAANTASATNRGLSSAQVVASKASAAALAAGKSVQQAIGDAIEHEDTKAAVMTAKAIAKSATFEAKKITDRVVDKVKESDDNHK
jgi:hypothetical protein